MISGGKTMKWTLLLNSSWNFCCCWTQGFITAPTVRPYNLLFDLLSDCSQTDFPTKILYAFLASLNQDTCPTHSNLLKFTNLTTLTEMFKPQSFSLQNVPKCPFHLPQVQVFSRAFCVKTLEICCLQPYKTTAKYCLHI